MKLLIDIPEEMYLNAKADILCGGDILVKAIKNGIPHETVTEFADRCRECGKMRTGHCKECKHFRKLPYHADTLGKCIHHTGFCPKGDWYCADFEPQERNEQ